MHQRSIGGPQGVLSSGLTTLQEHHMIVGRGQRSTRPIGWPGFREHLRGNAPPPPTNGLPPPQLPPVSITVLDTMGAGSCFYHAVAQAVNNLNVLSLAAPFFQSDAFLPLMDRSYGDLDFGGRTAYTGAFRQAVWDWLREPARGITEAEAVALLRTNPANIATWFRYRFLNPATLTYTATRAEAAAFVGELLADLDGIFPGSDATRPSWNPITNVAPLLREIFATQRDIMLRSFQQLGDVAYSDMVTEYFPNVATPQFVARNHQTIFQRFVATPQNLANPIYVELMAEVRGPQLPEWLAVAMDRLVNQKIVEALAEPVASEEDDDVMVVREGPPRTSPDYEPYVRARLQQWGEELRALRLEDDWGGSGLETLVATQFFLRLNEPQRLAMSLMAIDLYDWGEVGPLARGEVDLFAMVLDLLGRYDRTTVATMLTRFVPPRFRAPLNDYINAVGFCIQVVMQRYAFNRDHPTYDRYPMGDPLTLEEYTAVALQSIYEPTMLPATPENVAYEFGRDYRTQTQANGNPIIGTFLRLSNEEGFDEPVGDETQPDVTVMALPANLNYFMFGEGELIRGAGIYQHYRYLERHIPSHREAGDVDITLVGALLGLNLYVINTYTQGFVWVYQYYPTATVAAAPTIIINHCPGHYETAGYQAGELTTFFPAGNAFLRAWIASMPPLGVTVDEWYLENRATLQRLPAPVMPGRLGLPMAIPGRPVGAPLPLAVPGRPLSGATALRGLPGYSIGIAPPARPPGLPGIRVALPPSPPLTAPTQLPAPQMPQPRLIGDMTTLASPPAEPTPLPRPVTTPFFGVAGRLRTPSPPLGSPTPRSSPVLITESSAASLLANIAPTTDSSPPLTAATSLPRAGLPGQIARTVNLPGRPMSTLSTRPLNLPGRPVGLPSQLPSRPVGLPSQLPATQLPAPVLMRPPGLPTGPRVKPDAAAIASSLANFFSTLPDA